MEAEDVVTSAAAKAARAVAQASAHCVEQDHQEATPPTAFVNHTHSGSAGGGSGHRSRDRRGMACSANHSKGSGSGLGHGLIVGQPAWLQRKIHLRPQHRGVHLVTEEILRQVHFVIPIFYTNEN